MRCQRAQTCSGVGWSFEGRSVRASHASRDRALRRLGVAESLSRLGPLGDDHVTQAGPGPAAERDN